MAGFEIFKQTGSGGGEASTTDYVRNSYSNRFNETVNTSNVAEALDGIFDFQSIDPNINIDANPSFGLKEFGNIVVDPQIIGNASTGQNPIGALTLMEFYRGNPSGTLLDDVTNPNPSTNYNTVDTFSVSSNQDYLVKITDDQGRIDVASGSYRFVYPFYWGVVNDGDIFDGITRSQIISLSGMGVYVQNKSNKSVTTSPTAQRYCFMYPAIYGNLSTIIDNTGFDTISDYDIIDIDVQGLDGTTVVYRTYMLKDDTTQTNFTNQYNF